MEQNNENVNEEIKTSENNENIDPRFLDKNGNKLNDKEIERIKDRDLKEKQRKKKEELDKKMSEASKTEARLKKENDNKAKQKERQALKSQKIAKKKSRKRSVGSKYVDRFDVDPSKGLNDEEVNQRILEGFVNYKPKSTSKSIPQILFQNIFTFFNILTFTIAGFLISVNAIKDCIFVLIISLNIIIGVIQEIRAKKTIDKLSLISAPSVTTIRNGRQSEIGVSEVVLDDIMVLEGGKQICSDSIVVEGMIEVNESLLTGESDSIIKKPGDSLYSGSFVVSGSCKAKVEKVGKDNYIEQLTTSAKKYMKPKSELLRSLKIIIYVMAVIIIPIGLSLFLIQYKSGMTYAESIRKAAGAMIGMIPSGLFLCTSMTLAVGVSRLGKKNVLVQELYCIEMLARINVLCLDKTGTITDGSMNVKSTVEYKNAGGLNTKYAISALLNALNDRNMTSIALEKYFGRSKVLKSVATIPFSSKRKYQAATFDKKGTFVLGAPEFILKTNYDSIKPDVSKYAEEGYRVLLLAQIAGSIENNELPNGEITPMSLVLIEDNIRPDAVETIKSFKERGVEVKVISGDNAVTVCKIAERAGIENANNYVSLDGMSEKEVVRAATKYTVFGRVTPAQKRLLVKTLKENGKTVAMTGDGVNDILALKEADCSIAMASGSEAARNVSHLVLLDSNFSAMPSVVGEGKRVINNITKVARLYLTKTIFSLLLAVVALIKGYYPISTNQLFMIDLFCIGIPSVVLVLEKNNDRFEGHFLSNVIKSALPGAIAIVVESLIVFLLQQTLAISQTSLSTIIVLAATFTCEMVLFDVCSKPTFTSIHKILFYSMFGMFIFLTLVTPRFFDFSPLGSFGTYYSDKLEILRWKTSEVAKSQKDAYVVDGYVLYKNDVDSNQNKYYISSGTGSSHSYTINSDGKLVIDQTTISKNDYNYLDHLPSLYKTKKDGTAYYGFNGYVTNIIYSENDKCVIKDNGDVYYQTLNSTGGVIYEEYTGYNVLPTVTINSDNYYVVGNVTTITKHTSQYKVINNVKINDDYNIIVDGEVLKVSTSTGDEPYVFFKDGFAYGCDEENHLVVNISRTNVEFNQTDGFDADITVEGQEFYIKGLKSGINYKPTITTTPSNYYIVDGYLTEYECKTTANEIKQEVSSSGYLILDGIETNIKKEVYTSYGGNVPALAPNCIVLLFLLFLLANPLMAVVRGFVPFVRKWTGVVMDKINSL